MIKPIAKRQADALEHDEKLEANISHRIVLDMIGMDKRVLEFGCASGEMSGPIAAAGNRVVGIELEGEGAEEARSICDEVIVADLNARTLVELLPGRTFDVVVFGDVLQYLRDPRRVLEEARGVLGPGGYAVLVAPNVAHGAIRFAFLRGSFEARKNGPLDRSCRFFTLRSIHELCLRAGFRVVEIARKKSPIFAAGLAQNLMPTEFEREILRVIESDPDHDTAQFVIRAAPLTDDERLKSLVEIAAEAESRSNDALVKLDLAESQAHDLRQRNAELERRIESEASALALAEEESAMLRERLNRSERATSDADSRSARLSEVEAALASAVEQSSAVRVRGAELAEQLRLARYEVFDRERRNEALSNEVAALKAEAATARAALEVAREELAVSRAAAAQALLTFEGGLADAREEVANLQTQVALANEAASEAVRERDAALEAQAAVEKNGMILQNKLDASSAACERLAAAVEDIRAELERETSKLQNVIADRERVRKVYAAQRNTISNVLAHVESELERARCEISHIDGMIRQIQLSRWWAAKRGLAKVRTIALSYLRRSRPQRT